MEQLGTMQNGVIVLDNPDAMPDGSRVVVELAEDDWPDVPYPFHETREEIIASIRKELTDIEAGVKGISIEELRKELKQEFGPPYRDEQFGTMQNGVIVLDNPDGMPDGSRVVIELADEDWHDVPYPFHETREEIIASIRESIAELEAGVQGIPVDEAFARIRAEFGLPSLEED